MPNPFLILSPPRSGTAWLSQWLSQQDVYCYHELLSQVGLEDVEAILGSDTKTLGNADCANVWFVRQIKRRIPDVVLVGVTRPVDEVIASLLRAGPWTKGSTRWPVAAVVDFVVDSERRLREVVAEFEVPTETFADLFTRPGATERSRGAAHRLWSRVSGGRPFDGARWLSLRRMQIQLTSWALEGLAAWATTPRAQALWNSRDK